MSVFPNPATGSDVTIKFKEPISNTAKVYVYDALGKAVCDLSNSINPEMNQITWHGNSSDGMPCAPGLYHISVNQEYHTQSTELLTHPFPWG